MKRTYILLLLVIVVTLFPTTVDAQTPEGRPELRLPWPGGESHDVSCGYGCYQHKRSMTYGVDFDVPTGTPVVAAADGVVSAVTWEMGLPASLHLGDALIVYIDHGEGWFTRYVHLDGITVEVGQVVRRGEIIGYAGDTGASSPHLHFELKYGESLHAPSQPVDDLFGGAAPEDGTAYTSDNYLDASTTPDEVVATLPTATAVPTPTGQPSMVSLNADTSPMAPVSLVESLSVTSADVAAGEAVTVTFTLRNETTEQLSFGLVGVGARQADGRLASGGLSVVRGITVEPGDTYTFEKVQTYDAVGDLELFVFTFSHDYELLPIGVGDEGVRPTTPLHVRSAHPSTFLPLVAR